MISSACECTAISYKAYVKGWGVRRQELSHRMSALHLRRRGKRQFLYVWKNNAAYACPFSSQNQVRPSVETKEAVRCLLSLNEDQAWSAFWYNSYYLLRRLDRSSCKGGGLTCMVCVKTPKTPTTCRQVEETIVEVLCCSCCPQVAAYPLWEVPTAQSFIFSSRKFGCCGRTRNKSRPSNILTKSSMDQAYSSDFTMAGFLCED